MDAFSELMRIIRLNVAIYHNAMVCGNWRIHEKQPGITCFHMVTVGRCRLEVPEIFNIVLNVGDLVVFPKEIAHTMVPLQELEGEQQHLAYDLALKNATGMLCGEVRFQHHASNQLLSALPPVFIIPHDDQASWLKPIVDLIIRESLNSPLASNVMIDRLSELLFMYAVRHHVLKHPKQTGVLALYAHPRLATAMNAFHAQPELSWTLASLAKCAAQSRTVFAKTFREVSGWTVMEYIGWWRMQLAWLYLSEKETISTVAFKVGYQSESSFQRAFKSTFGVNAGSARRLGQKVP